MIKSNVWYENIANGDREMVAVFLEDEKVSDLKKEMKAEFAARGLEITFSKVETKKLSSYKTCSGIKRSSKTQRKIYIYITR